MLENIFANLPSGLADELFTTLLDSNNLRIERIVSEGNFSPPGFWYDQNQHEWIIIIQRAAKIQFADRTVELKSGDFLNLQAHQKHRVEWTTPDELTIWLAVQYGDR